MTGHEHTVSVLKADGTAFVVTHWETAEAALDQFKASLGLAGHNPGLLQHHIDTWKRMLGLGLPAYEVWNPDFTGSILISANPPTGRRMSTQ